MTVGFFNVDRGEGIHRACAHLMIGSVRRTMPGVRIVQFSDETTRAIPGVDEIIRGISAPLTVMIARHYRECLGDWLFIDTDVVIQQDVRPVCARPWDVAVAARGEGTPADAGWPRRELWRVMPFNCGVIFSRSSAFWTAVADRIDAFPAETQAFMGVQLAVNDLIAEGAWRAEVLSPTFNYAPHLEHEDVSAYAVVHYKGFGRKQWMLDRLVAA